MSDEALPEAKQSELNVLTGSGDQETKYTAYRDYYEGEHDTQLTKRQRKYLQIKLGIEFNANYCPLVVDTLAERLVVTGFTTEKDEEAELLWGWWQANRMDALQGIVHTASVQDGDTYLITSWDNEKSLPKFTYEPAYNGSEGVKIIYSKNRRGTPAYAFKRWTGDSKLDRLNLYYPNRIEKYIKGGDNQEWSKFIGKDLDDKLTWPLPWVDGQGQALGLPVTLFKNKDRGRNYGSSELVNVIPLQNALNKAIIDLVAAADTTGFRIYWMLGDDPSDLEVIPGSWVYSEKPPQSTADEGGVDIGCFPGEDLSKLIDFKDAFAVEIARVSRTPMHYFQISGNRPAEGTLKQEEAGLISRALNRQVTFGNAWEDVLQLAKRLHTTFGGDPKVDLNALISTVWKDPLTRSDKTHLETLTLKKGLGVPEERLWSEMGYSADVIAEMKESDEFEARQQMRQIGFSNLTKAGGESEGETKEKMRNESKDE